MCDDGSRIVGPVAYAPVPPLVAGMGHDQLAVMVDQIPVGLALHLDVLPRKAEVHGVAAGLETRQAVLGHMPRVPSCRT